MAKKKVLLPIEVPAGDYCMHPGKPSCERLVCLGARFNCSLHFYICEDDAGCIPKPQRCKDLKEA